MYIEHPEIDHCTAMQLPSSVVEKEEVKKEIFMSAIQSTSGLFSFSFNGQS
jgi:hypothetical protein